MEFHKMSAREIARGVKEKRFTAEEVARESIERIKTLDKKYNSVVTLCEEQALAAARRIEITLGGALRQALYGIARARRQGRLHFGAVAVVLRNGIRLARLVVRVV